LDLSSRIELGLLVSGKIEANITKKAPCSIVLLQAQLIHAYCVIVVQIVQDIAFVEKDVLDLRVQNTRGGELCFINYCHIFANSWYACSDRVFLTQ